MKDRKSHSNPITTQVQVRFSDIDRLGHVTNTVYHQYFDIGRLAYFSQVLAEPLDWREKGLIMVSTSVDFISPIKPNQLIEIRTSVSRLGNKSLAMNQEVFNLSLGRVAANSTSVMVFYNPAEDISQPIPPEWRTRIAAFEGEGLTQE